MRGILFDLDGVIYLGDKMIAGADDTLEWVCSREIPCLFVTNTTSRPRDALCSKLAGMGITVDPGHILSPPVAAANWLQTHAAAPTALFVPEATRVEFDGLPLWNGNTEQAVAAVVVGDLGTGWDFHRLNQAFLLLMQKPQPSLVALGMTRYWKAADGLRLDAGPFVAALQYATGVDPVVTGKPAREFFLAGADKLNIPPDQLLMIGDDIRGDVQGAQQAGLTGMLVQTGKFRPQDLDTQWRPDAVLASIADLPRWWQQHVAE
jgi:phospholysine phosphohistidine inorganic pyrophosphate phosphatase